VIRTCIYGVDLNPLAVELCKVALWLEAHNPGQPLNFLDHHIKCGNAIVGFVRREELDKGIPNEAFATVPGDDKEIAASWRRQNKSERDNSAQIRIALAVQQRLEGRLAEWNALSALPERTPAEIEHKKERFLNFTDSVETGRLDTCAFAASGPDRTTSCTRKTSTSPCVIGKAAAKSARHTTTTRLPSRTRKLSPSPDWSLAGKGYPKRRPTARISSSASNTSVGATPTHHRVRP
jgi:hypothetical protein